MTEDREVTEESTLRDEVARVGDYLEAAAVERQRAAVERKRADWAEYHAGWQGRREPHTIGLAMILEAEPMVRRLFRTAVPSEFWIEDRDAAVIACPCGAEPVIASGGMGECSCGRWFIFSGRYVNVYRPDKPVAS